MKPAFEFIKERYGDKPLVGAELGVAQGLNSMDIYLHLCFEKLVLIDIWENIASNLPYGGDFVQYGYIVEGMFGEKDNVEIVKALTSEASMQYDDGTFDFVYVDAGHDYDNVIADLRHWYPKVKEGGVLCGHDYRGTDPFIPDVVNAVDKFCAEKNLELQVLDVPNKTYLNSDWWTVK